MDMNQLVLLIALACDQQPGTYWLREEPMNCESYYVNCTFDSFGPATERIERCRKIALRGERLEAGK